jgi:hypothetical protein
MVHPVIVTAVLTLLVHALDPSRPSREVENIQHNIEVQHNIVDYVDFNNPEDLFAARLNQAVSSSAGRVWSGIKKHIIKNKRVNRAWSTVRVHVTSGNFKSLGIAGGVLGASFVVLKNLEDGVAQLRAYNKTLTNEGDRLNTIFNSSAKGFIEDFRNKTASLESIAKNVTAMADNKTEVFLNMAAMFLTEFKSSNSKLDTFNDILNSEFKSFNSKLDTFNEILNSKLETFNRILIAMALILFVDRVSELESASVLFCMRSIRPDSCASQARAAWR